MDWVIRKGNNCGFLEPHHEDLFCHLDLSRSANSFCEPLGDGGMYNFATKLLWLHWDSGTLLLLLLGLSSLYE